VESVVVGIEISIGGGIAAAFLQAILQKVEHEGWVGEQGFMYKFKQRGE
jgi:hypothetical protein